ncbi:hypothetical protein LguiA_036528 [Lonicera macranthoides]
MADDVAECEKQKLDGSSELTEKEQLEKEYERDEEVWRRELDPKNKWVMDPADRRALLYDSDGFSDDEERERDTQKYMAQVKASGGFQVDHFPKINLMGMIIPASDLPEEDMNLKELSILAVNEYNKDHSSSYKLDKVVNGTARLCSGEVYYLTFLAKEGDSAAKCFRAKVYEKFSRDDITVLSCDIEANDSSKAS